MGGTSGIGVEGHLLDSGSPGILTELAMLEFGPPWSGALLSRSSRGEDPPVASDWRKRAVGFLPLGSSGGIWWEGKRRCVGILLRSPRPLAGCGWGSGGNSRSGQDPS